MYIFVYIFFYSSLRLEDKYRVEDKTCARYLTPPQYIEGSYRGMFSIPDKSIAFTFSRQNDEESLYFITLNIRIHDRSFSENNSLSQINPLPYARFFDSGE